MALERAVVGHPFWSRRLGIFPSEGRRYPDWRHKRCRQHIQSKDILDVPCGEGLGLKYFNRASSITCLDYDPSCLEVVKTRAQNIKDVRCANMTNLPFSDDTFDVVVSLEGIEHIDKREGAQFLAEAWRVLRPTGELLLSCPICVAGLHSNNEFHRHEWELEDLLDTIGIGFDILNVEKTEFFGQVVWIHAKKRIRDNISIATWHDQFCALSTRKLQASCARLHEWLSKIMDNRIAPLWPGGTPSVMASCFAILATETSGIDNTTNAHIIDRLLSCQDQRTGLFVPGDIRRMELQRHSKTYLLMQATYFAFHALDAMGVSPLYRVKITEDFCDRRYLRGWLDGGPWQDPWLHSNNVMFALTFLERDFALQNNKKAMDAFDSVLDYLDLRQDPASGLWQPDDEPDMRNAVYAAYHFFPYYFWRGRKPLYIERIIDSVLSIQDPDGLFGGGACEDLDAVHTLIMMNLLTEYRSDQVRSALERCFWRVLQLQNLDGGFPNFAPKPHLKKKSRRRKLAEQFKLSKRFLSPNGYLSTWRYSGWKQLECPLSASDAWSSWFRPLVLKLIADHLRISAVPTWGCGSYRRLPGLGWHDPVRIRSSVRSSP